MSLATKFSFCANDSKVQKCSTDRESGMSRTNSEATLEPRRHGTERFVDPRVPPGPPKEIEFDLDKARRRPALKSAYLGVLLLIDAVLLVFAMLFSFIIRGIGVSASRSPS